MSDDELTAYERLLEQLPVSPLCFDPVELREWRAANGKVHSKVARAQSPCVDCTARFAAEMRLEDRCNGTPPPPGFDEWRTTRSSPRPRR